MGNTMAKSLLFVVMGMGVSKLSKGDEIRELFGDDTRRLGDATPHCDPDDFASIAKTEKIRDTPSNTGCKSGDNLDHIVELQVIKAYVNLDGKGTHIPPRTSVTNILYTGNYKKIIKKKKKKTKGKSIASMINLWTK